MQYKIEKIFLDFRIIASELVVGNYPYYYENTSSFQSVF